MQPEFSRIVNIADLSGSGAVFDIAADAGERRALAARFGLEALEELSARVRLRRSARGTVHMSARIRAQVVQSCVVTLEPVRGRLDETVEIRFREDAARPGPGAVVIVSPDDSEPLEGETLDVGEVVAGELALSLDPFPRAAEASAMLGPGTETDGDGEDAPESPFGALAALRRRD